MPETGGALPDLRRPDVFIRDITFIIVSKVLLLINWAANINEKEKILQKG
jgi:hypothetical protein